MIEKLTKAQEKKLEAYKNKWTKIGLCTKRANRSAAEKSCRKAYEVAGLTPPKIILWAESPIGLLLTAKLAKEIAAKGYKPYSETSTDSVGDSVGDSVRDSVWDSVGDSVRDSVRDSVWDSVWDSVRDSVWASVRDSVWASVRDSVRDSVGDSVRDSVWASVRDSVWASVRDSVGDSVRASVGDSVRASVWASVGDSVRDSSLRSEWGELNSWGQHDANWLGFYDYFREVCDLEKQTKKLLPLTNLAKETGWHLFYKDVAILSEKPTELHRNEQGRLHNFNGPAIKWNDGYELFRFNGVNVTKEIAEAKTFTKSQIINQENADVGREIIRKIGMEKAIEILEPEVLDTMTTPTGGKYELLAIQYDKRTPRPYLKMQCSSSKEVFILGVRPEIKKAKDALAFLNNVQPNEEVKIQWEA